MVSHRGEILSQSRCPVGREGSRQTVAEIDTHHLWSLVQKVILSEVAKHAGITFDCIGISAMLGYVYLDKYGQPLLPATTHADNRAQAESENIRRLIPEDKFLAGIAGRVTAEAAGRLNLTCGTPVATGSSDGTTAMYGAGILDEAISVLVSGTTDVLMTGSDSPPADPGRELCINSGMRPAIGSRSQNGSTPIRSAERHISVFRDCSKTTSQSTRNFI